MLINKVSNFKPTIGISKQSNNFSNPIKTHFSSTQNLQMASYPASYYQQILFKGAATPSFNETIKKNYFQLPILEDSKGRKYQAMPDDTQLRSAKSLYEGDNTVCIAPTGVGKTAIANYVITKNLKEGKKTYYTTPLKALSNDKYREFCKIYGEENVGLLTGDIKLKKDAPVLIMTTEIYRNMALNEFSDPTKNRFRDVNTVVFDEAHYIDEHERGKIWEESIVFTPQNMQILPLSATVGNAEEFASWIDSITSKKTNLIEASHKERFVPLVFYEYNKDEKVPFKEVVKGKINLASIKERAEQGALTDKEKRAIEILADKNETTTDEAREKLFSLFDEENIKHTTFSQTIQEKFALKEHVAHEVTQLLMDHSSRELNRHVLSRHDKKRPKEDFKTLIHDLDDAKKLPALIFKFSRNACDMNVKNLIEEKINLTTPEEKEQIRQIVHEYKEKNVYLGKHFNEHDLMSGVASHHAGLMPGYKKLVEELFSKKLLKVVFATSTLSAGINMPARSVVITQLDRPDDRAVDGYSPITVNEFQQMSGRAGRRGIDKIGDVILYNLSNSDKEIAKKYIFSNPNAITSKYSTSYNFLASYYMQSDDKKGLDYLLDKSLYMYQAQKNNPIKSKNRLNSKINKYERVLEKFKFLEKTPRGFKTTPMGNLLTKAHGYNELVLVKMIADKKLDMLDPVELASFAAGLIDSGVKFENDEVKRLVNDLFVYLCEEEGKYDILDTLCDAGDLCEKLQRVENENRIKDETKDIDVFSSYIAYSWLNQSEYEENSANNFKNILKDPTVRKNEKEYLGFRYNPFKHIFEGDVYSVLSQSVDVLKQIINISEYALENATSEEDEYYYINLIQTAREAVDKLKKPPLYDGTSVA